MHGRWHVAARSGAACEAEVDVKRLAMSLETLTAIAWGVILGVYALRVLVFPFSPAGPLFWNEFFRGETGILDRAEALLWIPVIALSALTAWRCWRREGTSFGVLWYLSTAVLCTFLLGEEISWGQHILGFASSEHMIAVNAQAETNLHNLNLSLLLGLPADSPLYPVLSNFNHVLNPAYYLLTCLFFIAIPVAKRELGWRAFSWMPAPSDRIVIFLAANVTAYLVIDKVLVDVGEIFELALTATYALAAQDLYEEECRTGKTPELDPRILARLWAVRYGRNQAIGTAEAPTPYLPGWKPTTTGERVLIPRKLPSRGTVLRSDPARPANGRRPTRLH
jgi:hypothetical protein